MSAAVLSQFPDPVKATVTGEFGPLFDEDTLPLTLPAEAGENLAVNDVLCPAPSVRGVVIPLTLKPVPEAVACEIGQARGSGVRQGNGLRSAAANIHRSEIHAGRTSAKLALNAGTRQGDRCRRTWMHC